MSNGALADELRESLARAEGRIEQLESDLEYQKQCNDNQRTLLSKLDREWMARFDVVCFQRDDYLLRMTSAENRWKIAMRRLDDLGENTTAAMAKRCHELIDRLKEAGFVEPKKL